MSSTGGPDDVLQRLDELERESRQRRAELRDLAASLPEATSRRTVLRSMLADLRRAPEPVLVAKRIVLKIVRTPSDLVRRRRP